MNKMKKIILIACATLLCLPGVVALPSVAQAASIPNAITITDQNGKNIADKNVSIPFFENTKGMSKKVGDDGLKLIKPGATGDYTFTVTSKYSYTFDFTFNDQNLKNIPLDYRIKVGDTYVLGSATAYQPYEDATRAFTWTSATIAAGVKTPVVIEWQWEDNDKYAAYSQQLAENSTLNSSDINPTIKVDAQQDDDDGSGGGGGGGTDNGGGGSVINNIVNGVTGGATQLANAVTGLLGTTTAGTATTDAASSSSDVIKADDATKDDTTAAAQKQDSNPSIWPWILGGLLGVAALAGLLWWLLAKRHLKDLIHTMDEDDQHVMHYWASGKAPLGYFDKYFKVKIDAFENAKKTTLMDYIFDLKPDFAKGDSVEIGDFVLQAYDKNNGDTFSAFDVIHKSALGTTSAND